jgi:hypothetical protein
MDERRNMKKSIIFFAVVVLFLGCGRGPNNTRGNGNVQIPISGAIAMGGLSKGMRTVTGPSALADAKKVLAFYGGRYSIADIVDGSFTAYADMGSATALVFLDANNKYIGNLFTGGLNLLPLGNLKNGDSTVIDLLSLSLDSTSVVPSHDPIGDEILITDAEVARLKELGSFFESLAKNIDADNDGVPDILNKKQLKISSHFSIFGGHWGLDNTPPSQFDTAQLFMNYQVRIEGNISMAPANGDNVALSGPAGNGYTDISRGWYVAEMDCFIAFFRREASAPAGSMLGTAFLPFMKGTYTFTLDGSKLYTLNYSNLNARYFMVIATPTLHTDGSGKITSVSVEYKLPDNTIVNPADFVTILQLSFSMNDNSHVEIGSLYESVKTNRTITDITNVVLPSPIELSLLNHLSVNYNDLLFNEYDVLWR